MFLFIAKMLHETIFPRFSTFVLSNHHIQRDRNLQFLSFFLRFDGLCDMLQAVSHLFLHFEREREKFLTVVFIAVEHNHVQCFLCTSVHIAQVETVSRYASVLCHSDGKLLHQRFGRSDAIALHRHLHEMTLWLLLYLGLKESVTWDESPGCNTASRSKAMVVQPHDV